MIRRLDRDVPRPAAYITGSILAVLLLVAAVQGLLFNVLMGVAERAASLANTRTSPGISQPNSRLLSGSPSSPPSGRPLRTSPRLSWGTESPSERMPEAAQLAAISGAFARPTRSGPHTASV
ncbi:alpha/beta-hydrolase N-terminal domain-containing protein [Streptomyces violascens]|uniref:alpha/beta-hydrolase N-terminal domain-containing protein n=1 Tax=Streptomyces violascens TaxID=67381 RepID=UPI00368412D4